MSASVSSSSSSSSSAPYRPPARRFEAGKSHAPQPPPSQSIRKEALNLTSEAAFPSLGASLGGPTIAPKVEPKTAPKLNYGKALAVPAPLPTTVPTSVTTPSPIAVTSQKTVRYIPTRCYDDGFGEDYDGPDEGEGEDDEIDESAGEFNADLGRSRRRGDNGIW